MSASRIRQLLNEGENPLEKSDTLGPMSYRYKFIGTLDKDWENDVARVKQAIAQEKALANEQVRRTLPSQVVDPNSDIAMTPEELKAWKKKMGYGGRHSRRHPRRHRGSRGGSSRMRSRGKRTSKKRNMRH